MNISKNLATNILQQLKNIINQDLNYINEDGTIIASTDPKRVGTFHAASVECIKREKTIIIRRYGLNGKEPMTQSELADRLGISRSYISRIEKKALLKLKKLLEDAKL